MNREFKELNLKRENLITSINKFCDKTFTKFDVSNVFEEKGPTRKRVNIVGDDISFYIDFHFNKKGHTTIDLSGGNSELRNIKENLANFIKDDDDCLLGDNSKNKIFVARNIDASDFSSILEIIEEDTESLESIHEKKESPSLKSYQYLGKYGELLTIEYYSTRTVVVKGIPLLLFSEVITMFSQLIDFDDIPKTFNSCYNLDVDEDLVLTQYNMLLPNSCDKLSPKLRKVILQAAYNYTLDGNMFDYTYLPFPALRALEGHLKYIVQNPPINISTKEKLGDLFKYKDKDQKHYLRKKYVSIVSNPKKARYIELAYRHYKKHRHSLFHWDDFETSEDSTKTIEDIHEARQLIADTLSLIDSYYDL